MTDRQLSQSLEVLDPVERQAVEGIMRDASLRSMTPWQTQKLRWILERKRGALILKVADIESHTVVAEAVVMAEGRRDRAREEQALATFKRQLACLTAAGHARDRALATTNLLTEDSRDLMRNAMDRATVTYIRGVEERGS